MAVEILYNINNITEKYSIANKVPVFATQEYADYLYASENIRTIWFIEEVKGQITFIIPLAIERKYNFKKGYFLTAVNTIDIFHFENEKKYLNDVVDLIKKYKICDWIQQPPNWAIFNEVPSNSIFCEYGTYRTNLEINTENELNSKLQHEARRLIKKAISNNIIIKSGQELIEDCSRVFSEAFYNGNKTLPSRKEIEKMLEKLSDHIQIYIAYYNSIPQSCVIFYSNQYCLYAVYAGLIPSSKNGVNHLLYWEAIKDAKKRGIKYFDFVGARIEPLKGSKQEYIQRFKKDFGGEFIKGFIWKLPISKAKYIFYNILQRTIVWIKFQKYKGDIIDQELKKKKAKKIILTIDYELYLGDKTGTVKECMIEPTAKLLSFLKTSNSKMTVFWDILHYYQLLHFEKDYPELNEDKLLIEKQILELAKSGHDIQLHLHPHWLDAKYENGKWIFNYDRFKLHSLKKESNIDDINTIIGCISISKKIIENIIRRVNPDYETTTFRAGGYLIEPFNEINEAFIANNIKIDSSVCSGLYNKNGQSTYDFRDYPLKQKYNFNITPKNIVESGHYVELPITTIKLSLIRNIYYKLLRKIKYSSLDNERKGTGINSNSINNNTITKKIISIFFSPQRSQFTTDLSFREKFNYIFNKVPDQSIMIMHPKLLNSHTLKIIDDYLSTNKLHFVSIKDSNS
jgi:hypothetical protein